MYGSILRWTNVPSVEVHPQAPAPTGIMRKSPMVHRWLGMEIRDYAQFLRFDFSPRNERLTFFNFPADIVPYTWYDTAYYRNKPANAALSGQPAAGSSHARRQYNYDNFDAVLHHYYLSRPWLSQLYQKNSTTVGLLCCPGSGASANRSSDVARAHTARVS